MKIKNLFLIAAIALGVLAFNHTATAQAYSAPTISVPAALANGTTNLATPPVIGPIKQQNVAFSATLTGTAGGTNTYTFNRSVDGINYDTNSAALITFVAATSAGQQNTYTTNFSVSGYGYLRLATITTLSTGTVTNGTHSYSIKLNSP